MADAKTAIEPLSTPTVIFISTKSAATEVDTTVAFFSSLIFLLNQRSEFFDKFPSLKLRLTARILK